MPELLDFLYPLLAQAPAAKPAAGGGGSELFTQLLPFLPIFILGYLLLVRPQQKAEQKRRAMINALKENDRVLTSAGIYGTVLKIDSEKNQLVLRCNDVKLTFSRASVVEVLTQADKDKDKDAKGKAVEPG